MRSSYAMTGHGTLNRKDEILIANGGNEDETLVKKRFWTDTAINAYYLSRAFFQQKVFLLYIFDDEFRNLVYQYIIKTSILEIGFTG